MPDSVNVGTLEALLKVIYDPSGFTSYEKQAQRVKDKSVGVEKETNKLITSFSRLAASLDPVVAKELKLQQTQDILNRSLKAGIITQEQYNQTLSRAQAQLRDTTTWTQRLGSEVGDNLVGHFKSLINPATLAIGAITGLSALAVKVIKDITQASIEAEASQRKVADAVARAGDRSGVTVEQIDNLANSLSNLSGKDDEVIADATALALKYNRISEDVLPRLTQAALDMAQVQGTDIPAAMEKSAKLVNQPLKALTLLSREGYAVGESQSKMVKDLLRSNDVLGAQKVILDILEEQYGDAAKEARDTLGGAFEALGTKWENLLEKLGEDNLGPMRQVVEEAIRLLSLITDGIDNVSIGWYKMLITFEKVKSSGDILGNIINTKTVQESRKRIADLSKDLDQLALKQQIKKGNVPAEMVTMLKLTGALGEERKRQTRPLLELTDAEEKLKDELKKQREEWEKLLEVAAKAVQSSQDDLSNIQALLQARKISTDAMKLQQAVQNALAKAQAAGKAATSEQRLEIIRNTIAVFQAKNAIDAIGEAQKTAADLFAESNKEMLRQLTILSDLAQVAIDLSKAAIEINIEQVSSGGQLATETTRARVDYAKEWRDAWKSARSAAQEEIERIKDSLLTIPEQERAIAEVRRQLLDEQLNEISTIAQGWTNLFSTLSNLFGGFGSKAINIINQMISTFQAVQSAGNSIGGQFGGIVSSAAPFLAIAGAIVGAQRESAARDRAQQYTSSAGVGFETGGLFEASGRRGRELVSALEATLSPIMELIDRTLASLPEIVVHAREDGRGFAAHINDVFLGYFATLEDAIDAAAIAALESIASSLPESLRLAIENANAQTSEELQAAIEFAVNYDSLGLSDMALRVKDLYAQLRSDLQEASRLGLGDGKILDKFNDDLQQIVYELAGVDTSTADILDNLIDVNRVLSQQSDAIRQQHQQRLDTLREELAAIQSGPRTLLNEEGTRAIQESAEAWERARRAVEDEIARLTGEIEKLPQALSDAQIDFAIFDSLFKYLPEGNKYSEEARRIAQARVAMEFELIKAKLIEIGRWEQFSALFNDAFNAAMAAAGREGTRAGRGGRGSTGGDRDSAREFLRDRSFEIAMRALGDYQRSVRELTRDYDIQIAAAGRDKKLREELIALREKELAQLANEQRVRTEQSFKEFMGLVTPFDQVRDTAADLIKQIEDSPYGDARKARMITRVLAEVEKQIERLSRQTAIGLFGEMLSDMQAFGATEEEMHGARVAMATLEHTLKLEHYRTEIDILKAQGKLAPEIIAKLEDAFRFLEGIDPSKFIVTGGSGGGSGDDPASTDPYYWVKHSTTFKGYTDAVVTAVDSVSDSLREAQALLTRYTDDAMNPYLRAQRDFNREWALIFAQFGQGPEIMSVYNDSLARLNEQFSEPLQDMYDEISRGAFGGVSIEDQFAQTFANWEALSAGIRGGDLSLSDEYREQGTRALELLGRIGGSTSAGYGELRDRLRSELGAVLGVNPGTSGSSVADSQAAFASTVAESINTQGTKQFNRLGEVVERLDTLVTVMGSPIYPRGYHALVVGE